jgi:hypothetical protein
MASAMGGNGTSLVEAVRRTARLTVHSVRGYEEMR